MEVILNINNLQYGNLFQNMTLSLEKEKIITISGSNYSGKTTLCRILDRRVLGDFNINLLGKDINDYSLEKYNRLIQVVYPKEYRFAQKTPKEEVEMTHTSDEKKVWIQKELKELKLLDKSIDKCTLTDKIWIQILMAILKAEEIIVIDNIDYYFTIQEQDKLYQLLRKCIKKWNCSIIMTTTSLDKAMDTDLLYILQNGEFVLHGEPITVLQHDNVINKAGLDVPFMIDLSVKLRDYELIKEIELEKERLIEALWN